MHAEEMYQMLAAAVNCQLFGADGITVHPRPDEKAYKVQGCSGYKTHYNY